MPDISMCHGIDCNIRDQCYRFTATPTLGRQAYFALEETGEACGYYWPNNKTTKKEPKNAELGNSPQNA